MDHPINLPPALKMYAVYYDPLDFPGLYVLRVWHVSEIGAIPSLECRTATELSEIRKYIPRELSCMEREEYDDACIVEVWC